MPSSEVAKCWATSRSAASKNDGARLISVSAPPAVPCSRRDGVRKPLESRKISSPSLSAATITVLVFAVRPGIGSRAHVPGVTTSTWLATSASVTTTSRSRVHEYWCRQVCSSGSKTTARSAVPSRNRSKSAASSDPARYEPVPVCQSVRNSISSHCRCTDKLASVGASMRTSSPNVVDRHRH